MRATCRDHGCKLELNEDDLSVHWYEAEQPPHPGELVQNDPPEDNEILWKTGYPPSATDLLPGMLAGSNFYVREAPERRGRREHRFTVDR